MAIVCKKCKYVMSEVEITLYISVRVLNFIVNTVLPLMQKKGIAKNTKYALYLAANILEIRCPACNKYEGWDLIAEKEMEPSVQEAK